MAEILCDAMEVDYDLSHHVPSDAPLSLGMKAVLRGIWDGRTLAEKEKPAQAPTLQKNHRGQLGQWFFVPQ